MRNKKKLTAIISGLLLVVLAVTLAASHVGDSLAAVYRQGSTGETVRTIQTKLKRWGYYTGSVDGVYGPKTVEAVKYFQRSNSLTADGICGPATLAALGISSAGSGSGSGSGSSSGSAGSSNSNDLYLLARMISAEARGEPYAGQVAVGAVILNRVDHPSFPNTLSGVLFQPGAFSAVNDGQYDQPISDSAYKAARDALNGSDPSGGAIYYYNPAKATSKWIFSRPIIARIGSHVFCT